MATKRLQHGVRCMAALGLVTALVGCEQRSTLIDTDRIYASMIVTSDGSGNARVDASLLVNGFQKLVLADDDALYAESGDQRIEMLPRSPGHYDAILQDVHDLDRVTIDLDRGGVDSAPNSTVVVPPSFALEPLEQESYGRHDVVPLRWSPTVLFGSMGILVQGDCIVQRYYGVPDFGTYDVQHLQDQSFPGEPCEVTITVTRSFSGAADPALDALSGIRADQVRTLTFVSTP